VTALALLSCNRSNLGNGLTGSKPSEPSPAPTPGPPPAIEPIPVTGSYLTCGWNDYAREGSQVSILCQLQTHDGNILSTDDFNKSGVKWDVTDETGAAAQGTTVETLDSKAEVKISTDYPQTMRLNVGLVRTATGDAVPPPKLSIVRGVDGAAPNSALGRCIARDGVASCFQSLRIPLFTPGQPIVEIPRHRQVFTQNLLDVANNNLTSTTYTNVSSGFTYPKTSATSKLLITVSFASFKLTNSGGIQFGAKFGISVNGTDYEMCSSQHANVTPEYQFAPYCRILISELGAGNWAIQPRVASVGTAAMFSWTGGLATIEEIY